MKHDLGKSQGTLERSLGRGKSARAGLVAVAMLFFASGKFGHAKETSSYESPHAIAQHTTKSIEQTVSCSSASSSETGVVLRLTNTAMQGNLMRVELRSAGKMSEAKGIWEKNEISFWAKEDGTKRGSNIQEAWLGIDLEQEPGDQDFQVTVKNPNGEEIHCDAKIEVNAGRFATESLKVEKQFVEPDAEQLARANTERQRLVEIYARVTPERLWIGSFRLPLPGIKTGGNFGRRRILNGQPGSPHTGVDFPAAAGTPVHAAQRGRVVLAEPLFFSGNTVILDHGLGIYTLYGHLQSIGVKEGQIIGAGALLGKVGATGRVTGPHLHWGLTVKRARVNALQIVELK